VEARDEELRIFDMRPSAIRSCRARSHVGITPSSHRIAERPLVPVVGQQEAGGIRRHGREPPLGPRPPAVANATETQELRVQTSNAGIREVNSARWVR
jgi:hypothetical protein